MYKNARPDIAKYGVFSKMASLATDGADKSSIISALVAQMKSGSISKNDLFEQLSKLHRSGSVAGKPDALDGDKAAAGGNQEQDEDVGAASNTNGTSSDVDDREASAAASTMSTASGLKSAIKTFRRS